jgi:hypothetical protein
MNLKPYQVGDYDIVLAENKDSAVQLLADYCGFDSDKMTNDEVEDLSTRLDMSFQDEEGNQIGTLGDWIKDKTEPEYIVGWE